MATGPAFAGTCRILAMPRRDSKDGDVGGRRLVVENESLALGWLRDFESSQPFSSLAAAAKKSLPGAVRVMAYSFTRRWGRATETPHPLSEMTADDAIDVLTEQLPRKVVAVDADTVMEGLIEFLIWATKTNKIQNRDVEYACRRRHHDAAAAMRDERKWAPGKAIVLRALDDGVDASDLERIRAHPIGSGLDASFVDEFLPPGPTCLGDGAPNVPHVVSLLPAGVDAQCAAAAEPKSRYLRGKGKYAAAMRDEYHGDPLPSADVLRRGCLESSRDKSFSPDVLFALGADVDRFERCMNGPPPIRELAALERCVVHATRMGQVDYECEGSAAAGSGSGSAR